MHSFNLLMNKVYLVVDKSASIVICQKLSETFAFVWI